MFPPLLPFTSCLTVHTFYFIKGDLRCIFTLYFKSFIRVNVNRRNATLSRRNTSSKLFLFRSSIVTITRTDKRINASSIIYVHTSKCPGSFTNVTSITGRAFRFPFRCRAKRQRHRFHLFLRQSDRYIFSTKDCSNFRNFLSVTK